MEEGSVMMVGLNSERILQALELVKNQARGAERIMNLVADYAPLNVSEKVLRIILSYTDFVNRKIWKKT
jgi:UDP-N-acetylglucosamine 2-epimerase (non-hydrolysing)